MKKPLFLFIIVFHVSIAAAMGKSNPNTAVLQQIDSLLSQYFEPEAPGGAISIISEGEILYQQCFGLYDPGSAQTIDESTLFDLASVAKPFTAVAVLLLEKEGKLILDDDIHSYLPDLPDFGHTITIRHLLQHSSGIPSTDVLRLFAGKSLDERWTQEDEINLIKTYSQLNFEPNTRHVYSNAGYALLAQIVETVSGMSFPQYMEQAVFQLFGMQSTFVYVGSQSHTAAVASGYALEGDAYSKVSSQEDLSYGSGNIYSNLRDMSRWVQHLLDPESGGRDLLPKMATPYNTLHNGDTLFYTYGFYVRNYKGQRVVDHSGGVPGFRSRVTLLPDEGLAIMVMLNTEHINSRQLTNTLVDMLLADQLIEPKPKTRIAVDVDMEEVKKYAGTYQMPDGMEMRFSVERDTFWLSLPGAPDFQLFAESKTQFFLKAFDAQCSFVISNEGEVNEMIWHQGKSDYTALRVQEREPLLPEELLRFAGSYLQKALNAEYTLAFENEQLQLQLPATFQTYLGFGSAELTHISGDTFMTDRLGMLTFTRDASGTLTGFVLQDVGRLQQIQFIVHSEKSCCP